MHISYKPLWHTLLERDMRKEDLRITDVIELVPDEPASTGGKEHERIETKNNGKRN